MNKINRTLLIIAFLVINTQSFSQLFGIRGGGNISNSTVSDEYGLISTEMIFGLNIGGNIEFSLGGKYSLEPGLIINYKGYKLPIDGGVDTTTYLVYLDIPINVKYGVDIGKNNINLTAGPYLGIGLSGLFLHKINGEKNGEKVKWGSNEDEDDFKRLDYGINVGAEYEFGSFGIGLQYGLGFANILTGGDSNNYQRNRCLSVFVAYKFGKKNK